MSSYSKLDKEVFEEFFQNTEYLKNLAAIIKNAANNDNLCKEFFQIENDDLINIDEVKEGQIIYKLHKVRERNKNIVKIKKNLVLNESGKLICEACGFDFEDIYGEIRERIYRMSSFDSIVGV